MIVRIFGEDQYRLADGDGDVERLDDEVLAAADSGDEARFEQALSRLLDYVRSNGERLTDDELAPSDLILPPADITLAEARSDLTGDGWIPD